MTLPHNTTPAEQLSRRELLQTAALGTVTLGTAAMALQSTLQSTAAAEQAGDTPYIDAHVHVWTPDTRRYPLRPGYSKDKMNPASFTPGQLFSHAHPSGVGRIVLIQMSFYRFDNSYMLDAIKAHPGVFSGVAVIDQNDNPRQTMINLKGEGVRGFRLAQGNQDPSQWINSKSLAEMWKTGGETGQAMCYLCQPNAFSALGQMCKKFPGTPVVIDHFGRIGIDGEMRKKDVDNLCALAKHKMVHVKTSAFYALGKKQAPYTDLVPMIRRLLDAFGPERLMWASDGPFQVRAPHQYKPSIDLIKNGIDGLSQDDRQWLLQKTAQRVFFS